MFFVTTTRPASWKKYFQVVYSFSSAHTPHSSYRHSLHIPPSSIPSVVLFFLPALTPFLLYSVNKVIKTEQTNNVRGSSGRGTIHKRQRFSRKPREAQILFFITSFQTHIFTFSLQHEVVARILYAIIIYNASITPQVHFRWINELQHLFKSK